MRARRIDVLVGTQIVGKGHHFPALSLVGVVDADVGLSGGDPRALERTWAALHQAAGRAGRRGGAGPARALVQTRLPGHPVMRALETGDARAFLAGEAEARRAAGMPPFGRLAALVVSSTDEAAAEEFAARLAAAAPRLEGLRVLGPAVPPLAVLRRRHRRRLLVQARPGVRMQEAMRPWIASVRAPPRARLSVDVDPYGFM